MSVDGVHDDLRQDFGYRRFAGSIGDTVYQDANENATQDLGEPGIQGVTVRLFLCGWGDANADGIYQSGEQLGCPAALTTAVTTADDPLTAADEGGKYLFSNLATPSDARTITAVTTAGSTSVTSAGLFLPGDVGTALKGSGITHGAYVTAYTDASSVTISASATATGSVELSTGQRYYLVAGNST